MKVGTAIAHLLLIGVASVLLGAKLASAQPAPRRPLLLVVSVAFAPGASLNLQRIEAVVTLPDGRVTTRSLGIVRGVCVEDVGGMDSLVVVRCDLTDGGTREFEFLEVGRQVVVDTYSRVNENAERRRTERVRIATRRRGWAVVPRCPETYDNPRACLPVQRPSS